MVTKKDIAIAENIIFQNLPVEKLAENIHKIRVDAAEEAIAKHVSQQSNFKKKREARYESGLKKWLDYFSAKQKGGQRK